MCYNYSEMSKLEKTIIWVLESAKERKISDLALFQVYKLIYLIEVESRKFAGKSFFDNQLIFVRAKNGPISADIQNALEKLSGSLVELNITKKWDYGYPRFGYKLANNITLEDLTSLRLSEGEMAFIDEVVSDYIGLTISKLKQIAYETEPMTELLAEEKAKNLELIGKPVNLNSIHMDIGLTETLCEG